MALSLAARALKGRWNRLRYHPRLGPLLGRVQWWDDFDWGAYPNRYRADLTRAAARRVTRLAEVAWSVEDGRLVIPPPSLPLHPWHRAIYETALRLRPTSIFEAGCGAGDHLANLRLLLPGVATAGCDISAAQLAFARERNGELGSLSIRDLTQPDAANGLENSAELVFCQTVLMHLHGDGRQRRALATMGRISRRYVLLAENPARQNLVADARAILPDFTPYLVVVPGGAAMLLDRDAYQPLPPLHSDAELRRADRGGM